MPSLIARLKAHRRLLASLIWLVVAAVDHFAFGGEMTAFYLTMAVVWAVTSAPAKYFQYQPRRKNRSGVPADDAGPPGPGVQ